MGTTGHAHALILRHTRTLPQHLHLHTLQPHRIRRSDRRTLPTAPEPSAAAAERQPSRSASLRQAAQMLPEGRTALDSSTRCRVEVCLEVRCRAPAWDSAAAPPAGAGLSRLGGTSRSACLFFRSECRQEERRTHSDCSTRLYPASAAYVPSGAASLGSGCCSPLPLLGQTSSTGPATREERRAEAGGTSDAC
jgi:hypothetical protein